MFTSYGWMWTVVEPDCVGCLFQESFVSIQMFTIDT